MSAAPRRVPKGVVDVRDPFAIEEVKRMWICGACAELNGTPGRPGSEAAERIQHCACRRVDEPVWPRHDYNEHAHLCECCLMEALPSGSRFSVWFCRECCARVQRLNDRLRVWLIPVGRHSFQVQTYDPPGHLMLEGALLVSQDEERKNDAIESFLTGMFGSFSSMDRLHEWSTGALRRNLGELGFGTGADVRLSDYLRAARSRAAKDRDFDKLAAFRRLEDHMRERA